MKVIGVTGGVGAGKSMVLDHLSRRWDAFVIQADQTGHQVMEPGGPCYDSIVKLLGEGVKGKDGALDRKKIGDIVFRDEDLLKQLNRIVHPAVKKEILARLKEQERMGRKLCAVEAALLLEDHYEKFCDEIWYVYADVETRVERLVNSRGYTREKAAAIIKNQASEEFFRSHADQIIENNGNWEETRARIDEGVGMP